jgi:hypothetical protein
MTTEDELKELRAFKAAYEGKAINRAFARLEELLSNASFEPVMSARAFRALADCLLALKDRTDEQA